MSVLTDSLAVFTAGGADVVDFSTEVRGLAARHGLREGSALVFGEREPR